MKKINLFVIGDSTASDYEDSRYPRTGWAQVFGDYFVDSLVNVVNAAASGRSTRSFYNEKRWEKVKKQIQKGDYVFIQFGHNDEKDDTLRHTDPFTTYQDYLKTFINETRAKDGNPVLLTPIQRNHWKDDEVKDTHGKYPEAMRQLAKEMNVPLIDMTSLSEKMIESKGKEQMSEVFLILEPGEHKNYPEGITDNTHLREKGAREICKKIIESIKEKNLPLEKRIK